MYLKTDIMKQLKILFSMVAICLLVACTSNSEDRPSGPASLTVKLMDAPGDFEHVYVVQNTKKKCRKESHFII